MKNVLAVASNSTAGAGYAVMAAVQLALQTW